MSTFAADDLRVLLARSDAATVATWLAPSALASAMLGDTRFAAACLETLREPASPAAMAVTTAFPELGALAAPMPTQVEHTTSSDRPLLDHVATRSLGTRLAALESKDNARWPELSSPAFAALAADVDQLLAAGHGPALRLALLHLDIAKSASTAHRAAWAAQNISLEVHNEAAATILRAAGRPPTWPMPVAHAELALAWIEAHGLAGQHIRGEGPLAMLTPFVDRIRALDAVLDRQSAVPAPGSTLALALAGLHVINACDTAAVRDGLLDDILLAKLSDIRTHLARTGSDTRSTRCQHGNPPESCNSCLTLRLRALRAGRQANGEPVAAIESAVAAIGDTELAAFLPALAMCQLWYCEAATSALSPAAQLGVLAAAVGTARAMGVDTTKPWHAQLRPLVARLHGESAPARYRVRLVEAALAATPLRALLTGNANLGPLGALSARLAHPTDPDAIVIDFVDTEESAALVTLLGLYETRSQIAFHTMLKALCDLYGLRKDEFDRVANEANYLATMNAARSDKERMLDYVKPGTIVEIGPGGGVVLDLLEQRYPESRVIGVDLSREAVAALQQKARAGGKRWSVVLGAAEDLAQHVPGPVDTVVFCSILHEVYSYTEPKFQLASVEHVIQAAFATLAPGGRIVIRDGVMPPAGTRRIRLLTPEARATLDLYCEQFEGRRITYRELATDRVEMTAPDAMEFLYTYTWGPASFPYEVRELYGILPYSEYIAKLIEWCGGDAWARVVENALGSYLQPGYPAALAGKIELTDEHDRPVALPDSNCLIVIEKRA
jgi:SAM-dependent methyltransferase